VKVLFKAENKNREKEQIYSINARIKQYVNHEFIKNKG
jgi:hypothetical protein